MNCRDARDLLTRDLRPHSGPDPALTAHLAACPECRRFADRWMAARAALAKRQIVVTPDAGFAARVITRLGQPADPLVWAARRLLPATLALTLALGGWCLLVTPTPSDLADELAQGDLLTWVAAAEEDER